MTQPTKTERDPWSRLATEVAQTALMRMRVDKVGLKKTLGEDPTSKRDRSAVLVVSRGTLRFKDLLEILYKSDANEALVPLLWREPVALKATWAEKVSAILASECNAALPTKPWLPKLLARLREDGTKTITEKRLLHHLHTGEMHLSFGLQCLAALNSASLAEVGLISRDALARARKEDVGMPNAGVILKMHGFDPNLLDFTNSWPKIQDEDVPIAQNRLSGKDKVRDATYAAASKNSPSAPRPINAKPKRISSEE